MDEIGELSSHRGMIAVLLLAVAAAFGISLLNDFVWDDRVLVMGRDVYRNFDLGRMFLSPGNGMEYLPLRDLTYAIDYLVWGERPAGFHLTNVLLHLAAVAAVHGMTARLAPMAMPSLKEADSRLIALLASMAFGLHPIQSQAVNFIICRNVLLSGLFFFLACSFYLSFLANGHSRCYASALLCFLAALLSKATVLILPLVLLLFTLLFPERRLRQEIPRLSPFFLLAVLFFFLYRQVAVTTGIIPPEAVGAGSAGIAAKVAVAVQIPFFYLKKLLLPIGLSAEYAVEFSKNPAHPGVMLALAVSVVGTAMAVSLRHRLPELLLCLGWFAATLVPVLNFFGTVPIVADRYVYLPAWGFCFAFATLTWRASRRPARPFVAAVSVIALVAWGGASFVRSRVWHSDVSLWEDALRVAPQQTKAALNLGEAHFRAKDYQRAFPLLARAKGGSFANNYYDFYQGVLAAEKGELTLALNSFKKALEWNDDFMIARYSLAEAYERLGDLSSAVESYNLVLLSSELDSNDLKSKSRSALQRLQSGFKPELDAMRSRVAAVPSDLRARGDLALRLDRLGMYDEALVQYEAMERLGMKGWQLPYNISNILKKQHKFKEALAGYERSAAIQPTAEALNNIGWIHMEQRNYDRAVSALQQAVSLDGSHSFAWFNLGLAYSAMGDRESAMRTFDEARQRVPQMAPKIDLYLKKIQE